MGVVIAKTFTGSCTACNSSVKEACGGVVNSVLEVALCAVVVEVYCAVKVVCNNKASLCNVSESYKSFTTAEDDSALDDNVFKGNVCRTDTVTDDKVAVDIGGVKMYVVTCKDNFALVVTDGKRAVGSDISREDIVHDLCKFFSCYVVCGTNCRIFVTVDVSSESKGCKCALCEITDLVLVGVNVEKMGIFGVDDKGTGDNEDRFLTGDGVFGMHGVVFITCEESHVDSLCHHVVIPFVRCDVGIFACDVSRNFCTECSDHDGSHFGTGKELSGANCSVTKSSDKSVFNGVCHSGIGPTGRKIGKSEGCFCRGKCCKGNASHNKNQGKNKRQHVFNVFHAFLPFSFCFCLLRQSDNNAPNRIDPALSPACETRRASPWGYRTVNKSSAQQLGQ